MIWQHLGKQQWKCPSSLVYLKILSRECDQWQNCLQGFWPIASFQSIKKKAAFLYLLFHTKDFSTWKVCEWPSSALDRHVSTFTKRFIQIHLSAINKQFMFMRGIVASTILSNFPAFASEMSFSLRCFDLIITIIITIIIDMLSTKHPKAFPTLLMAWRLSIPTCLELLRAIDRLHSKRNLSWTWDRTTDHGIGEEASYRWIILPLATHMMTDLKDFSSLVQSFFWVSPFSLKSN